MDAPQENPLQFTSADDFIVNRQAALLRTLLRTIGVLTLIAILLIIFLPGFATGDDILEPFLRNAVIVIVIGVLLFLIERGNVRQAFFLVLFFALIISPYSAYMEAPGNMQMMAVMMVPIGLSGFLPHRRQFWMIYAVTVVLTLATAAALLIIKQIDVEYRSFVTLTLLLTIFALMVDALSSSYRDSVRITFEQLRELQATQYRLTTISADLDHAVTARVAAETESEARVRSERHALQAAGAGIIKVDLSDMTVSVSTGFLDAAGLGTPLTTFKDLLDLMQADSQEHLQRLMDELLSGQRSGLSGDFQLQVPGRSIAWFIAADLLRDRESGTAYLNGIVVDASDRILTATQAQHRDQHNAELKRLDSLTRFAGGVAHEFNNLLQVIMLQADQARMAGTSGNNGAIDQLLTTAEQAALFCRQLLAYSGGGQSAIEPIDLFTLLRRCLDSWLEHNESGTRVIIDSDQSDPVIDGDAYQLELLHTNLISFAASADAQGPVYLTMATIDHDGVNDGFLASLPPLARGRYAAISVSYDSTSATDLTAMFEPFAVADRNTNRGDASLGLAAVTGIVRANRGGIRLRHSPEEPGIDVLLPLGSPVTANTPLTPQSARQGGGKVLFADDETEICNLARIVLGDCGFDVIVAHDGIDALARFHEHREDISLVILDVMMPGKTGTDVCKEIHLLAPDIPVILSSGFSQEDAMRQIQGLGPVRFLKKPYLTRKLKEMALEAIAVGAPA